jgi:hypothetical protein
MSAAATYPTITSIPKANSSLAQGIAKGNKISDNQALRAILKHGCIDCSKSLFYAA